jgi:coatomer subunit beta'
MYPPAEEYMIHAERSNENLVEAFKNMQVHEDMLQDDDEDTAHEVQTLLLQKWSGKA